MMQIHIRFYYYLKSSHRLPRDKQRDRKQQTLYKSLSSHREWKPVLEQLATDQTDPLQVVPRQEFTPYSRLLISSASVVVSRVGCLGVTSVVMVFFFVASIYIIFIWLGNFDIAAWSVIELPY